MLSKRDKLKIKIDTIPTMYKPVKFLPQNFGGYTLSMLLSGSFLGLALVPNNFNLIGIAYFITSLVIFFVGMYFYAKDNIEENE